MVTPHAPRGIAAVQTREHALTVVRIQDAGQPETDAAVIVMDSGGSVIHSSASAGQLFAEYCAGETCTEGEMPELVVRWLRETDVNTPSTLTITAPWGRLRMRALSGRTPEGWRLLLIDDHRTAATPSLKALRTLGITDRQAQVLRLLACGHSTQKIAEHLYLSPATVRKHLENIYDRLGVKSRTEAVALAVQQR